MKAEDFTKEELILLNTMFRGANEIIESLRKDWNYDYQHMSNTLYNLSLKLGVEDIIDYY